MTMTESGATLNVLQQLEEGHIDVDEALRRLDEAPAPTPPGASGRWACGSGG